MILHFQKEAEKQNRLHLVLLFSWVLIIIVTIVVITFYSTKRKKAEQERETLSLAIEQSAEAVTITDIDANFQYVNPAFEVITGYTKQEVLGCNPRLLQSGKHDSAFYSNMWETIKSGQIWRGEIINKRKTGELYEEEMTISPVFDNEKTIVNFIAIKRDVSKEKRLREQLIQAENGTVVIAIENNGPAIMADQIDKIFEPFYSTKEAGEGTGLGLYISYGIIKDHKGDILVKNHAGLGVEFVITIPVADTSVISNERN